MEYQKSSGVSGSWVDKAAVVSGTKAKIKTECMPSESVWQGKTIKNNVAKVRFETDKEAKNVNINKPTIDALVDAFGGNSMNWIDKVLTAHTEKVMVAGKRNTALYFIPEGYEIKEDDGGYLVITKIGKIEPPSSLKPSTPETGLEYPTEDINPDDIPF